MAEPKDDKQRREVRLDPALQERLLQQMRDEADGAIRMRMLRRYVLLPLCLLTVVWSGNLTFSSDQGESMVGSFVLSSVLWLGWKLRKRLPALWGLD